MNFEGKTREELEKIIEILLAERELKKKADFEESVSKRQVLSFEYAKNYFAKRKISFNEEEKVNLNLINSDNQYTNLGLLLSDQCEHSIKCAIFSGDGKTQFRTRKEFFGSILKQLEGSYDYINLYNNLNTDFAGLERVENHDYPLCAIRETLINAIIHRDYEYSGSTLVNMFLDRLEIISIGGLVEGISLLDILRGMSQPRNMALANIFYRLKLVEGYGTGIARIFESYSEDKKPEIIPEQNSFGVILPNTNFVATVPKKVVTKESITEGKVLKLFEESDMISRKDIEKLLDCSGFPARKVLTSLLEKRKIQVVGNGRATRYILL